MNTQPVEKKPQRKIRDSGILLCTLALTCFVFYCCFAFPSLSLIYNPPTGDMNFDALALLVLLPLSFLFGGLEIILSVPACILLRRPKHKLSAVLTVLLILTDLAALGMTLAMYLHQFF